MKLKDLENGIFDYINVEFCPKLTDWRKWGVPLAMGFITPYIEKKYLSYLDTLKTINLVNDEGDIDIDTLYTKTSEIAKKTGCMNCSIPILGEVTFSSEDVDKLYHILKRDRVVF